MKRTVIKSILSKIKIANNGCWEWQRGLNTSGYGQFHFVGYPTLAHRAAYQIWIGDIDPYTSDCVICHKCDNKKCINPFHLFKGTQKENVQDAIKKGRLKLKTAIYSIEEVKLRKKQAGAKFRNKNKKVSKKSKIIDFVNSRMINKSITITSVDLMPLCLHIPTRSKFSEIIYVHRICKNYLGLKTTINNNILTISL
jgi:hypothetical protein